MVVNLLRSDVVSLTGLCILAIMFINISCVTKKPFSGIVHYELSYTSNMPEILSSDSLTKLYGKSKIFYIQDSFYKYEMNGNLATFSIYDPSNQIIYNKSRDTDTVYYFDATKKSRDSILSFSLSKKSDVINGILCDKLVLQSKYSNTTYYFNTKYSIDPSNFENHSYDNWYYYLTISKSLPLKVSYKNSMYSYTMTFTRMKHELIEKKYFYIDTNSILIKGLIY